MHTIARFLAAANLERPLKVGIDGIDAAGKTRFADHLATVLASHDRQVVRVSLDSFHNPRQQRYARGSLSPEGYFLDSFNLTRLVQDVLEPLSGTPPFTIRWAAFDHITDQPVKAEPEQIQANAVVLLDGIFLCREELRPYWDVVIFLDIPSELSLQRARTRDLALLGSAAVIEERYLQRYLPAQRFYLKTCLPVKRADFVINNRDPLHPRLVKSPSSGPEQD